MSDIIEFGFDDGQVVKNEGGELFKQSKPNQRNRISVVSFKTHHESAYRFKQNQTGKELTDVEKAEIAKTIDEKIAEKLKKPVAELSEVDRLDIRNPKMFTTFTHFVEGVGTFRCLSKYVNLKLDTPKMCCKKYGDASQTSATVIMTYPEEKDGSVDLDLLKQKKHVDFYVWKLSANKFNGFNQTYKDSRNDDRFVIDLRVTLDGDAQYQKQKIEFASSATWAREDMDPNVRRWILESGLRYKKHIEGFLGQKLTEDKLIEKLNKGGNGGGSSPQLDQDKPKGELQEGYASYLT